MMPFFATFRDKEADQTVAISSSTTASLSLPMARRSSHPQIMTSLPTPTMLPQAKLAPAKISSQAWHRQTMCRGLC